VKFLRRVDGSTHANRQGIGSFWPHLVVNQPNLSLVQDELDTFALRTPGLKHVSRWHYQRCGRIVAQWCQEAAQHSGEACAVPFDRLARIIVAGLDGTQPSAGLRTGCGTVPDDLDAVIGVAADLGPAAATRTPTGKNGVGILLSEVRIQTCDWVNTGVARCQETGPACPGSLTLNGLSTEGLFDHEVGQNPLYPIARIAQLERLHRC
jgi:hypothetical protein